jgi:hypothetical protein
LLSFVCRRILIVVAIGFIGFQEGIEVKDQRLEILGTFLELPDLLVTTGFVVQHSHNDVLVDRFTATRSVL